MKYLVYVNSRYMVSVEAESNLGAEHKVLDNIPGATTALSFDNETMKTDTFIGCMMGSETISYNELLNKQNAKLADVYEHYNTLLDKEGEIERAIQELEARLHSARGELTEAMEERESFAKAMRKHCVYLQGYTSREKIAELRGEKD